MEILARDEILDFPTGIFIVPNLLTFRKCTQGDQINKIINNKIMSIYVKKFFVF